MRVHFLAGAWDACGWYRCQVPAAELVRRGHDATCSLAMDLADMDGLDVLVVQRARTIADLAIVREANRRGILTIFELDDYLWDIHPTNPACPYWTKGRLRALEQIARECKRITTTTPALARELKSLSVDVRVLPNSLPDDPWRDPAPIHDVKVIGWAGSQSHLPDMEVVGLALGRVLDARLDCEVHLAGMRFTDDHERLKYLEVVRLSDYPDRLRGFSIGIAPLADTRFNACKSDLKVLEYAALGLPVVASHVPAYRDTPALLAHNDAEWERMLLALLDDDDARVQLARRGKEWSVPRRISNTIDQWVDAYS